MKVKDIIKDDKFNEFLGYEKKPITTDRLRKKVAGIAGHRTTH